MCSRLPSEFLAPAGAAGAEGALKARRAAPRRAASRLPRGTAPLRARAPRADGAGRGVCAQVSTVDAFQGEERDVRGRPFSPAHAHALPAPGTIPFSRSHVPPDAPSARARALAAARDQGRARQVVIVWFVRRL